MAWGGLGHPLGELGLEPVAALGADAEVAAGLAVDPAPQVDPVVDLVEPLAVPGHVLAEMAVGLGAVVAEAAEHVDADLLGLAQVLVPLVGIEELAGEVLALVLDGDVPGLVVDAGADDVHLLLLEAEGAGDLAVAPHDAVAETEGLDPAEVVGGPGEHGVRVAVAEHHAAGGAHFADVAADAEDVGDAALPVHDPARAEGVAHALVHAVLERDVDVGLEGLQPAHAGHVDDVLGAGDGFPLVEGLAQLHPVQSCRRDVAPDELVHHVHVAFADVHVGDLEVGEGRHSEQIGGELAGETDAAGSDEGDLERHGKGSWMALDLSVSRGKVTSCPKFMPGIRP